MSIKEEVNIDYPNLEDEEEETILDDFLGISELQENTIPTQSNPFMNFNSQMNTQNSQMLLGNSYQSQSFIMSQRIPHRSQIYNVVPLNQQYIYQTPHRFNPYSQNDLGKEDKLLALSTLSTAIPSEIPRIRNINLIRETDEDIAKEFKFNNRAQNHNRISNLKVEEWIENNHKVKLPRSKKRAIQKFYIFLKEFSERTLCKKGLLKNIALLIKTHQLSDEYLTTVLCINKIFIGDKLNKIALCTYFAKLLLLEMFISKNFKVQRLDMLNQIEDGGETILLLDFIKKL